MGFLPSHLRLLIRSHRKHAFQGPVCTLGNQETWASYAELEGLFRTANCAFQEVRDVRPHSSKMFSDDPVLRELARDFVHARVFFQMLGIEEYTDIDAFDFDRPAMLHDLNQPIPAILKGAFGTVVDGGTIEHIFDVKQALANAAQLLRVGGHVIHMASFEMDHGFYSLSPCLLFDFYATNGFSDFECFILQFDYENILSSYRATVPYFEYRYGMPLDGLFDSKLKPAIFFVARKNRHMDKIALPFQGIYSRRAGLAQAAVHQNTTGAPTQGSVFEAIVPAVLQRPLASVRPFLSLTRRLLTKYLESRKRATRMKRI